MLLLLVAAAAVAEMRLWNTDSGDPKVKCERDAQWRKVRQTGVLTKVVDEADHNPKVWCGGCS